MVSFEKFEIQVFACLLISGMGLYEKTRCKGLGLLEMLSVQKYKKFGPCSIFINATLVMQVLVKVIKSYGHLNILYLVFCIFRQYVIIIMLCELTILTVLNSI